MEEISLLQEKIYEHGKSLPDEDYRQMMNALFLLFKNLSKSSAPVNLSTQINMAWSNYSWANRLSDNPARADSDELEKFWTKYLRVNPNLFRFNSEDDESEENESENEEENNSEPEPEEEDESENEEENNPEPEVILPNLFPPVTTNNSQASQNAQSEDVPVFEARRHPGLRNGHVLPHTTMGEEIKNWIIDVDSEKCIGKFPGEIPETFPEDYMSLIIPLNEEEKAKCLNYGMGC